MIDDNVVVLDGNYIMKANTLDFTHRAMIEGIKLTSTRFPSWCYVFDDNVTLLNRKLPYEF